MRVLAIDTALAACSAAVLDTEHGGIVASESLPMLRGTPKRCCRCYSG
jgi:tRNA threonylcarbamoyladenosine biosynthesis protein TsaB